MERYRVRANFHNNLSPRTTTALQTKPPSSHISLPPKQPVSSFLQDSSELSIFDAKHYFDENPQNAPKKMIILDENGNNITTNPRDSSVSSVEGYAKNWQNRSFGATPTASSEASWNSQTGLLLNPPGSAAFSVKVSPLNEKRKTRSPFFSSSRRFFGRNCPCYGKKSVDVEEKYCDPKSPIRISSDKAGVVSNVANKIEEGMKMKATAGMWAEDSTHRIVNSAFSFPILAPPLPPAISALDDPARDSIEVFRPADELATIRQSTEFPRMRSAAIACDDDAAIACDDDAAITGDDDAASDTSSDLFEIESFSTNLASRRHNSLDEFPKTVGPVAAIGTLQFRRSLEEMMECYAPSEVSVMMAEGRFDQASLMNFSSAASDYVETRFIRHERERFKKKGAGGLLSCQYENSVNVGQNPVRIEPGRRQGRTTVFGVEPEISRVVL